ncbi:MAG: tetratricopeptide repeat protein [Bacteroidetes bacterium]|nr:tetratricopeptide repeat protein [Bacteroidota bacterium]
MKRSYLLLLLLFLACFNLTTSAQKAEADSLYKEYAKATVDTTKINLLLNICYAYSQFNYVKGLGYAREALELSERINYVKGVCKANSFIGDYHYDQLNYSDALKHYLKGAAAGEINKMYMHLSNIYNKMGIIYSNQGKNDLSLKYFMKVAKISENQKNTKRLAIAYNNIGITYKDLGRYSEAKKYYEKALIQFKKNDFKVGIASVNNGLGIISHILKDDEAALKYYDIAMENFRSINDTANESGILINIGDVYNDKKEYKKALDCYLKSVKVAEQNNNSDFRADGYEGLSSVYANMKNYELAFYFKNRHLALKDSISDEDGMRQVQEMEKRLDNEKQEKEIEILKQSQEIQSLKVKSQSEKLKRSNVIIYSVAGILAIVLAMSFFIFKAYKEIKRTNIELAEKKKEIQDSINYAKRIQEAMLPDVSLLERHFPKGGFGLFLPKDVVSGDFYWFNELDDTVYFAVADCTGHGVPGAFMSMIGMDKLNSLIDKKVEDVSEILSSLNVSIKRALKQQDGYASTKDGLDIVLCSLNGKTNVLQYAGANRPMWILRNGEIVEYKPTKASIAGYTENSQAYTGHSVQLQSDDIVYLFSDGFADQFGGPNKKKYMSKLLKQTFIDIHQMSMAEQEIKLKEIFNTWKGELGQVDDVLVLGFKV